MKINKKHIHRGELLQKVVDNSGMTIINVTKKAGFSRSSYYNHIADPDLSLDILLSYGKAMKFDFVTEMPEIFVDIMREQGEKYESYNTIQNLDDALKEIKHWREKYFELLERYNAFLEQRLGK